MCLFYRYLAVMSNYKVCEQLHSLLPGWISKTLFSIYQLNKINHLEYAFLLLKIIQLYRYKRDSLPQEEFSVCPQNPIPSRNQKFHLRWIEVWLICLPLMFDFISSVLPLMLDFRILFFENYVHSLVVAVFYVYVVLENVIDQLE